MNASFYEKSTVKSTMIERTLVVMKQSAVKFTVIEKNTVTKSVLIKLIFSFELYC